MAGYPPSGYPPYGAPPPGAYGSAPPYGGDKPPKEGKHQEAAGSYGYGYGQPAGSGGYGVDKPPKEGKHQETAGSYGYGYGQPSGGGGYASDKPPKEGKHQEVAGGYGYGYSQPQGGGGYGSEKPPKEGKHQETAGGYGQSYGGGGYGVAPPPYGGGGYGAAPPPYGDKPPKEGKLQGGAPGGYGAPGGGSYYGGAPPVAGAPYGSPFSALVPSVFPPGTDPNIIACFQAADRDGSGIIDDKELQQVLSSYNQTFSMRTVHLLMYLFTSTNVRKIGPKEFTSVFYSLQNWRSIFERFDRDRSGKIDPSELREALLGLGFAVSPMVLDLLISKFDKSGGKTKAIEYDNFIECCLTVKGLTEKFKEKDLSFSGSATFSYETFMLTVLPFLIA